ncbi:MAG: hypothetical protein ACR2K6_00290 [Solirubrobacterales bacterium]
MDREQIEAELELYEHRFHRAGLPLLDEDFSVATDVYNRAAPLLALVFVAELLGAIQLEWSLLANVAAGLGGLAVLLAAFAAFNRARGRELLTVPEDVGGAELAAFVLIPAALPLIFGAQVPSAIATALGNGLLLALLYPYFAYGVPSILRWVVGRLARQLLSSFLLLARAVPLLLIFVLLAFINTEMWEVFSAVPPLGLAMLVGMFMAMGVAFLVTRLPAEVVELEREVGTDAPALSTRQRRNVGAVLLVGQGVQVLIVTLLIFAFFVAFGAIAIGDGVRESWIGTDGDVLLSLTLFGDQYAITAQLLRVAIGLASFSGLYFAVAMLTDSTYREEFLEEVTAELRVVFRQRAEYMRLRASLETVGSASPPPA